MIRIPNYKTTTFKVLIFRLFVALLLISLSRILIYSFNHMLFPDMTGKELFRLWFFGLRFDVFTLVILNLPFILLSILPFPFKYLKAYRIISDLIFYTSNIFTLALNFIDVVFFRYQFKRLTWDIFDFVTQNQDTFTLLFFDFIKDFFGVFMVWVLFCLLLILICSRIKADPKRYRNYSLRNYIVDFFTLLLISALSLIAARGGIQDKPINIAAAGKYTTQVYAPIILNTPYTIIKTKDENHVNRKEYFPNDEARMIFDPVKNYYDPTQVDSINRPNIVLLILESFSAEYSKFLSPELYDGSQGGYMPFLDSLMEHSLVFKAYANGKYSLDAMPAILAGLPGLTGTPYLTSPYVYNKLNAIPIILKELDYSSAYFHGGNNGTLGLIEFSKIAGFDNYYGRDEFGDDTYFNGGWGIYDEEFLQYSANVMNEIKKPFFATVFTLSSHHPWILPDRYRNKFGKDQGGMLDLLMYADFSLQKFFDTAKSMEWFENTLFILVADHTATSMHPSYASIAGQYLIPIVFFKTNMERNKFDKRVAQQADILPTLLDYLNYQNDFVAFGNSLFDSTASRYAIIRNGSSIQLFLFHDQYLMLFENNHAVSLYDVESDSLLQHDIIEQYPEKKQKMENMIKSILQQYNDRLIDNKLTAE